MLKSVENAVRSGTPLLIEDVGESLEPLLEPLFLKQFTLINRRKLVRLGDSDVEYDPAFKLFLSTKFSNPNFLPDIFIRVTVINFTVTEQGLEEQLLGDVVSKEMPEVEATKQMLI
jgi:dynein heavy chain